MLFLIISGSSVIKERSPSIRNKISGKTRYIVNTISTIFLVSVKADRMIDPMHLIFLGVVKRLIILYWIEGKRPFKMSRNVVDNINNQIRNMKKYISDDFPRKIRPFSFIKKWKATEYRFFFTLLRVCSFKNQSKQ